MFQGEEFSNIVSIYLTAPHMGNKSLALYLSFSPHGIMNPTPFPTAF